MAEKKTHSGLPCATSLESSDMAVQQFIGFEIGTMGTSRDLVDSMSLNAEEWKYVKKRLKHFLRASTVEEVDAIFESK